MISTPVPQLRCAIQTFKLHLSTIRPYHGSSALLVLQPQRNTTHPRTLPQQPQSLATIRPQLQSLRFASDTSRHPASTHPSASSPAASNPASVPPAPSALPTSSQTSFPSPPPSSPSSPSPSPSINPSIPTSTTPLTWNTYLTLRRHRRTYSRLASLLTSTSTTLAGLSLIQANFDQLASYLGASFGADPILMLGLATLATGAAGWLVGPVLGEGVFRVVHRREWGRMAAKEKDFYTRIRAHRVDPSLASYSNPLPDYYGEKIGSVAQYRTWLRDQRAYNRKRVVSI